MHYCLYYPQQLYDDASDQISYHLFACYSSSQETLQLDYERAKEANKLAKEANNGLSDQLEETTAPINLYGMPVYQKIQTEHIQKKICVAYLFYKTKKTSYSYIYLKYSLERENKTDAMYSPSHLTSQFYALHVAY